MRFAQQIDDDLELHLVEPGRADEVFAVIDANREGLGAWMPWVAQTRTAEATRDFARRAARNFAEGTQVPLWIAQAGRIVGGVGLAAIRREREANGVTWACADIGYWLAAEAQGRGIVTRAVTAVLDHAFDELGLHRVTIRCEPDNGRSRAVPERLGFAFEGVLRHICHYNGHWVDHRLYAMLADDWKGASQRACTEETTHG